VVNCEKFAKLTQHEVEVIAGIPSYVTASLKKQIGELEMYWSTMYETAFNYEYWVTYYNALEEELIKRGEL